MDMLYAVLSWGSPLGIGLFLFLSASGTGIFFWGISHLSKVNKK
jgi:hypothetical protein